MHFIIYFPKCLSCFFLYDRDFGRIEVSSVSFMTEEMQPMVAKLYRPVSATQKHQNLDYLHYMVIKAIKKQQVLLVL